MCGKIQFYCFSDNTAFRQYFDVELLGEQTPSMSYDICPTLR